MAEKYTEAQARASKKYLMSLAEVRIRMHPTTKEQMTDAAKAAGQSLNSYILEAVDERIRQEQDGAEIPPEFLACLAKGMREHGLDEDAVKDIIDMACGELAEQI